MNNKRVLNGREAIKAQLLARLGDKGSAAELADWISTFEGVEAYRKNDDLLLVSGADRCMMVRRIGPNEFRVSKNIAGPSTNLLDFGGGIARDVDRLIDEIAAFAAS